MNPVEITQFCTLHCILKETGVQNLRRLAGIARRGFIAPGYQVSHCIAVSEGRRELARVGLRTR